MKEAYSPAGSESSKYMDRSQAEVVAMERQVHEAKLMLEKAGITKAKFPDLYLAIEEAMDDVEEETYRRRSGSAGN